MDTKIKGAFVGAATMIILSLIPIVRFLSPIIGGFIAGYIAREGVGGGAIAGFLSGIFSTIPIFVIIATLGVTILPLSMTGGFLVIAAGGFALVFLGVFLGVLGAVGGLLGGAVSDYL